ncbi:hypothetical protein TESG_06728 [Trichophyton tonsurans CBS 112818]|uniref:Uncharacterized protein n=1 Tax=Trichophyton tonsurans (strain CBS 112818) TaxID=647933 RepID=F2S725_TRIT1|nr:hypothetical protein TESG_06728 [Trichophyton tonsurans CBS 112818]
MESPALLKPAEMDTTWRKGSSTVVALSNFTITASAWTSTLTVIPFDRPQTVQRASSETIKYYLVPLGEHCRSEQLGVQVAGPGQECSTVSAGTAKSVIVKSTGKVDDNFYAVFFSSDDCDPNTVILHTDSDKCQNVEYKSFKVWDVDAE